MKDKLIFTFLLFSVFLAKAQQPICKDVNEIASIEMQAHAKRINQNISSLTMASGNYQVTYYRCEWNINPAVYNISGKVMPFFTITKATSNIVFDLSHVLKVDSVVIRKRRLSFTQSPDETLIIQLPKMYSKGKRDSLSIYYKGAPNGSGFGSFIQSTHTGTSVIWTLS